MATRATRSLLVPLFLGLAWMGTAWADDAWSYALGGGIYEHPKFPGADSGYAEPLPYFDIRYGEHLFFNALQGLGVKTSGREDCWLSASIGPDLTRRSESDDPRLQGLGDVHYTGRLWLQAGASFRRYTASVTLGRDLFHEGQGTIADFEFFAHHYPLDTLEIDDGVGLRWADGEYTRSFFGVDAGQSQQSGLPQYAAGSGIASLQAFLRAHYALSANWILVTNLAWNRLQGDAVLSPITESRDRFTVGVFLVYGF